MGVQIIYFVQTKQKTKQSVKKVFLIFERAPPLCFSFVPSHSLIPTSLLYIYIYIYFFFFFLFLFHNIWLSQRLKRLARINAWTGWIETEILYVVLFYTKPYSVLLCSNRHYPPGTYFNLLYHYFETLFIWYINQKVRIYTPFPAS